METSVVTVNDFISQYEILASKTEQVKRDLAVKEFELNGLKEMAERLSSGLKVKESRLRVMEQASVALGEMSKNLWEFVKSFIEDVVNRGLATIFGEGVTLEVESGVERSQSVVDIWLKDHGKSRSIEDAEGGSAADLVSFLLRLVSVLWINPSLRRFIMFDEPFKFVDAVYLPKVADLLKKLGDCGVQFLISTHLPQLMGSGKTFLVKKVDGVTNVTEE